jgi:hypothetical protein
MRYFNELMHILAWPGAVVLLGYLFRKDISDLLMGHFAPKPQRIAYRMSNTIKTAEGIAEAVIASIGGKPDLHGSEAYKKSHEQLQRLAKASPRAAIIETWVEFEANIQDVAEKLEIFSRGPLGTRRTIEKLVEMKKVHPDMLTLYISMREVRNKATYVPDYTINNEDAERYFEIYYLMMHVLNTAAGLQPTVAHIGETFSEE